MATTYKILGRAVGGSGSATTAYTVPTGKYAVISSFVLANTQSSTVSYSVIVAGGTLGTSALLSAAPLAAYSRIACTWGITLTAGESIQVSSTLPGTLTVFGSEVDI